MPHSSTVLHTSVILSFLHSRSFFYFSMRDDVLEYSIAVKKSLARMPSFRFLTISEFFSIKCDFAIYIKSLKSLCKIGIIFQLIR